MILLPGGIQSISIFERNGALNEFVTTSGVRDFTYEVAENYFETASGKRRVVSRAHTASMVIVDLGVIDQLKEWEANETAVEFVALGLSRHVQGYDASYLNITPLISAFGANTAYRVDIVNEQFTPSWYSNANLVWYKGWSDSIATGVPDGYDKATDAVSMDVTFNATNFEATVDVDFDAASQYGWLYTDIPIPVAGAQVTASCEAGTFQEVQTSTFQMEVKAYNYAKSSVLAATAVTFPGNVRSGVTLTLPDDTYYVRVGPSIQAGAYSYPSPTQVVQTFKFPSLFVGSSAPEAKY